MMGPVRASVQVMEKQIDKVNHNIYLRPGIMRLE